MYPPAPKHIIVVGSLNADFVLRTPQHPRPGETVRGHSFVRYPGGKGANQAYAAARLSGPDRNMARVTMIGQVGDDSQGLWLRENLARVGVDVSGVVVNGPDSGVAVIAVNDNGQNQIVVVAGANGTFTPDSLSPHHTSLRQANILLLQLEIPLPTVQTAARLGHDAGAIVILDPAPACPMPDGLLGLCDYVTPNQTELFAMIDGGASGPTTKAPSRTDVVAAARRLLARGSRNVIVKLGQDGAVLVTADTERFWPAFNVRAVDTTAAGDTFNAAFAVGLAEGLPIDDAGRFACAAAALSVTKAGAQPSVPNRNDVLAMLTNRRH